MKVKDLKDLISRFRDEDELVVSVVSQGSIGPSPSVKVTSIHAGFDWDRGNVIIYAESPLTELTPEDVESIRKSVHDAQSFHTMKLFRQMREKHQAELAALRQEHN